MTFKQFLIVMLSATLVVWLVWLFLLFNFDPTILDLKGFVFFYVVLTAALIGTMTVVGTSVRRLIKPQDLILRQVTTSFRQAFWLSATIIISLILLSNDLFHLWIISLVIMVFTLIELAFLSARRVHLTI